MNTPTIILVIGFIVVVVSFTIENYKKDKNEKKNLFEYAVILLAIILGAITASRYYNNLMPIAMWSLLPGVIAAFLIEARRRRKKDL